VLGIYVYIAMLLFVADYKLLLVVNLSEIEHQKKTFYHVEAEQGDQMSL
jgi:hypothetical protein